MQARGREPSRCAGIIRKSCLTESRVQPKCPKHDTPLVLRQNTKTGEVSLACISCDVEERAAAVKKRHD